MTGSILELVGVVKRYGDLVALGPVDFSVQEGEFLTLLGPSGCGKTTTLNLIAGLLHPDAGRIIMRGKDITVLSPAERGMGVVFQNYALFPHKTVAENIGFGLRMRKMPKADIAAQTRDILSTVGLPGVEERYPRQLSGGQRQRVALARALVIQPSVLLLDEPLSNLDAMLRSQMRRELRAIQRQSGNITAIYVTHDQSEAFEMSDRVILLNEGRIVQVGPPEELYDRPNSRFSSEFIGDANLVNGEIGEIDGTTAKVDVAGDAIMAEIVANTDLAVGNEVHVVIRPERIGLTPDNPGNPTALSGTVKERVFAGEVVRITVTTEAGIDLRCVKPSLPEYRVLSPGQRIWIVPEECWAIPRET